MGAPPAVTAPSDGVRPPRRQPGAGRNGRSRASFGTFTQTSTGPVRTPTGISVEGCAEGVGAVGLFPGEALAPEVAVRGGLLVDWPAQIEVLDDGGGPEVEHLPDHVLE